MNARHWSLGLVTMLLAALAWGCEGPSSEHDHDHDHAHEAGDHDHDHDGEGHAADHDATDGHDHDGDDHPVAGDAKSYRMAASDARAEIAKIRANVESGTMSAAERLAAATQLETLAAKAIEFEAAAAKFESGEHDDHDH